MSSLAVCDVVVRSVALTSAASKRDQGCSLISPNFINASRISSRRPWTVCCAFTSLLIWSNLFAMFVMRRFDEVRRENVVFILSAIVYCHSYNSGQFSV